MNTPKPFVTEFKTSLGLLWPYAMLATVIAAALFSEGSWAVFFDKTLLPNAGIFFLAWLWMGAVTAQRRRAPGGSAERAQSSSDDDTVLVNPSTGLPMVGNQMGGFDVGGTSWGASDD